MPSNLPNLTYLKQFLVIAEEKGISNAARRLNISQPALSKNLRKLEETVGTSLFERHSRGATLTTSGKALVKRAATISLEYQHALQEIQNILSDQEGVVRLGAGPVWSSIVVPEAIVKFRKRFPRHRVIVQTGPMDQLMDDLLLGRLDIVAGAVPPVTTTDGLVTDMQASVPMTVICAQDHPLCALPSPLAPTSLAGQTFVAFSSSQIVIDRFSDYLKNHGASPPVYGVETTSLYACIELVRKAGYLLFEAGMIADHAIGAGLVKLEMETAFWTFDTGLIYRDGLDQVPVYNALLAGLRESFPH